MSKHLLRVVVVLLACWPVAEASAQDDQVIHACYIPLVGVVYRIKAAGLPIACLSKTHVEFQWNVTGPQGPAGNLGLAGQTCSPGSFVAGFSSTGTLVCAQPQGGASDVNPLLGLWPIPPDQHATCVSPPFSFPFDMRVASAVPGQIVLNFNGTLGGMPIVVAASAALPNPLAFPFLVSAQGSIPVQASGVVGTINWTVDGQFNSATNFIGIISTKVDATVNGEPGTCAPIIMRLELTR